MAAHLPSELGRESARKRGSQILAAKPVIQGTLVQSLRTCGTPNCRCHLGGPKHSAVYLAVRHEKKRTMICVSQAALAYVQQCVSNHQQLQQALDVISRDCIEVFLSKKRAKTR